MLKGILESSRLDFTVFWSIFKKPRLDFVLDSPPPESSWVFYTFFHGPFQALPSSFLVGLLLESRTRFCDAYIHASTHADEYVDVREYSPKPPFGSSRGEF